MMLLRDKLNHVEPIKCPRKVCNGILPRGKLTPECPKCGQLFMAPQLFPEALKELETLESQQKDKQQ